MTGPEGAVTLMAMVTGVIVAVTALDWWSRRKDHTSHRS